MFILDCAYGYRAPKIWQAWNTHLKYYGWAERLLTLGFTEESEDKQTRQGCTYFAQFGSKILETLKTRGLTIQWAIFSMKELHIFKKFLHLN